MRSSTMLIALALAGLALFLLGRLTAGGERGPAPETASSVEAEAAIWTCPMHPQIRLPEFGPCPVCGMDLVPLSAGAADPRRLELTPAAAALASIETSPVRREAVARQVRLVGKLDYDETAVRTISAWVPGRLDRLFVDYTGVRVEEGDHLVRLYSPALLTAQEELLAAAARREATGAEQSPFLAESSERAYRGAREKLRLFGLTTEQVAAVESRGTAEEHVMLTSPTTGVVIEKYVDEGAYVETGTRIYSVADLGHLWVRLDAYEQDLPWLRPGQEVTLEAEARPGEPFDGRISFIDPVVHEATRTSGVRVIVDNQDGRLKPGMFVRAVVRARLGPGGRVEARDLAGKWVSPMHPEIVKDSAGECDVCGMDLVPAEELGLVSADAGALPLVVPASAVLLTGRRAVVYVEVPEAATPTYEGREVLLGPRAGDAYVVRAGLEEGERVVTRGAFRIDSSMQIRAQPSMMSQPAEAAEVASPELLRAREAARAPLEAYLGVQAALAEDDPVAGAVAWERLGAAIEEAGQEADGGAWGGPAAERLRAGLEALAEAAGVGASADLEAQRDAFARASGAALELAAALGAPEGLALVRAHCPMAEVTGPEGSTQVGADWLQVSGPVANPYMGSSMLRCGTLSPLDPGALDPDAEERR